MTFRPVEDFAFEIWLPRIWPEMDPNCSGTPKIGSFSQISLNYWSPKNADVFQKFGQGEK